MTATDLLRQFEWQRILEAERWTFPDSDDEVDDDGDAECDAIREAALYEELYGGDA